jgi:hypothetical protein
VGGASSSGFGLGSSLATATVTRPTVTSVESRMIRDVTRILLHVARGTCNTTLRVGPIRSNSPHQPTRRRTMGRRVKGLGAISFPQTPGWLSNGAAIPQVC